MLTPVLRCGRCGAAMHGDAVIKEGNAYLYYRCLAKKRSAAHHPTARCNARRITAPRIEDAIRRNLTLMVPGADMDAGVRDLVGVVVERVPDPRAVIEAAIRRLDDQRERLRSLHEFGECDWEAFLVKRAEINAEKKRLEEERDRPQQPGAMEWCRAQVADLLQAWDQGKADQRARLLSTIFERIEVLVEKGGGLSTVAVPRPDWRPFFQIWALERETGLEPGEGAARHGVMRKLILLTSAGGALALIGGTAGAVAAVVARTATPAPSATSTLFFPSSGQNANPGGSADSGSGSAGGAYIMQGAMPAPLAAAGSQAIATRGAVGYSYPSPSCGNAAPVQVQGSGITATGMVQVPLGSSSGVSSTLSVGVQSNNNNGSGDVKTALADVQQRLAAIHDAIRAAGIPESAISQQSFNVWANGNPKPAGANVNGSITVAIADAAAIDRVINAAVSAGANNLNLWSSNGAGAATPSDAQVRSAITKATSAAHDMAQAEAQGAGLSLGSVHAITAQPPSLCPWAQGGPQLVVAVTVTYDIK